MSTNEHPTTMRPRADDLAADLGDDPAWSLPVARVISLDLGRTDLAEVATRAIAADDLARMAEQAETEARRVALDRGRARRARAADAIDAGGLPMLEFEAEVATHEAHQRRARDVRSVADESRCQVSSTLPGTPGVGFEPAGLTADDDAILATWRALVARGWTTAARQMTEPRCRDFDLRWFDYTRDPDWPDNNITRKGDEATELERLLAASKVDRVTAAIRLGEAARMAPSGGIALVADTAHGVIISPGSVAVSPVRVTDLPADVTGRIVAGDLDHPGPIPPRVHRTGPGTSPRCGEHFDRFTAFERHDARPIPAWYVLDLVIPTVQVSALPLPLHVRNSGVVGDGVFELKRDETVVLQLPGVNDHRGAP